MSWVSLHTQRICRSSTEAECHALVLCGSENKWVREFLSQLNLFNAIPPTLVFQDNKSAILLSTGGPNHKRSKFFGLEWDLFREYQKLGEMRIEYINTNELPADMLTKNLPTIKFEKHRNEVMGGAREQDSFA